MCIGFNNPSDSLQHDILNNYLEKLHLEIQFFILSIYKRVMRPKFKFSSTIEELQASYFTSLSTAYLISNRDLDVIISKII